MEGATLPVHKRQEELLDMVVYKMLGDFPKKTVLNSKIMK
jgi:hypothetical protein